MSGTATPGMLICIFSYNRGRYLANLLRSVARFYPETDFRIWDDNSTDPETVALLQTCGDKVIYQQAATDAKHGGLYRNMDKALQYAAAEGYSYAYFVQDDMQFVCTNAQLLQQLNTLFANEQVCMVNANFLARIAFYMAEQTVLLQHPLAHVHRDFGVADTGIIDVAKAVRIGLAFDQGSERKNGENWKAKGFNLMVLHQPDLCWVPWPDVYRNRKKYRSLANSASTVDLLVKPLTAKARQKLWHNTAIAYLEDYTSAANPLMIKPYWYQEFVSARAMVSVYCKYYMHRLGRLFVKPRIA